MVTAIKNYGLGLESIKNLGLLGYGMNLKNILKEVFDKKPEEKVLVMHDTSKKQDNDWRYRIELAKSFNLPIASYDATNANNADLPKYCVFEGGKHGFELVLSKFDIVIALL